MDWRRILRALAFTVVISAMIWTLVLPLPRPRPFQVLLPLTAAGPVRFPLPTDPGGSSPTRRPLGPVYVRPTPVAPNPMQQKLDLDNSAGGSSSEENDDAAGDQPDYAYNHDDSAEERRRAQKYVANLLAGSGADLESSLDMKNLGRKDAEPLPGKGVKGRRRIQKKKKVTATTTMMTTTSQSDKPPPPVVIFAVTQTHAGTSSSTATILPSTSKTKSPKPSKPTATTTGDHRRPSRKPSWTLKPEVENEVGNSLEQLLNDDLPGAGTRPGQQPSKGYRNPYLSYYTSSDVADVDPQLEGASYADLVRIKHELIIGNSHNKWNWWWYFLTPITWFKNMLHHIFCRWQQQKHWSCAIDNDDWRRSFAGVLRRWSTN